MRRAIAHGLIFTVGGVLWAGASVLRHAPAPEIVRAPYDLSALDREVDAFQARCRLDPQGALNRALLASAYLRRFQERSDPSDLARAETVATDSLRLRAYNNALAHTTLARALMSRHQFARALGAIDRLPASTGGGLRAECLLELGRYDEARACLGAALSHHPDDPGLAALSARLWEIDGRPDRAERLYREALSRVEALSEMPRPTIAWFRARLGANLALQGRRGDAEAAYASALEAYPDDPKALLALARLRWADGDTDGARDLAERSDRRAPTADAALLRAELAEARGDRAEASRQEARALDEGGAAHSHGRPLALWLADRGVRLDDALRYALADLDLRWDLYAYDTLAWVRLARGEVAAARAASRRAMARGTRDPKLLYHAGCIARAAGDTAAGNRLLAEALAIDPHFDGRDAPRARTLLETP